MVSFKLWLENSENTAEIAKSILQKYLDGTDVQTAGFPPGYLAGDDAYDGEVHDYAAVVASAINGNKKKPMCLVYYSPHHDPKGIITELIKIGDKYGLIGGYIDGGSYVYGRPESVRATAEAGPDDHETIGRHLGFPEKDIERFVGDYGVKYRGPDVPSPTRGKLYDQIPDNSTQWRPPPPEFSFEPF